MHPFYGSHVGAVSGLDRLPLLPLALHPPLRGSAPTLLTECGVKCGSKRA
jgi:hypothetical protein